MHAINFRNITKRNIQYSTNKINTGTDSIDFLLAGKEKLF